MRSINNEEISKIIEENKEALIRYTNLLIEANEVARLTGAKDFDTLWQDHIVDSCYIVPLVPQKCRLIDVGTGGGLPGVVIAITRPDVSVTLLDSIAKKVSAVEKICYLLGLKNVTCVCQRSEDYAKLKKEKFSIATARAVTAAGTLAEYLAPFVRREGQLIAFKGPRVAEELEEVGNKWATLGLASPQLLPYSYDEKKRYFCIWHKAHNISNAYPRRIGMAEKFPWYK